MREEVKRDLEKLLMAKSTPEEINRKKEYVRFLTNQIYKLTSQKKLLDRQLEKVEKHSKRGKGEF